MAKLNINFRKYHRALLSEVLPFELPIIFNNDGFFLLHEHQDKKSLNLFLPLNMQHIVNFSYFLYHFEDL